MNAAFVLFTSAIMIAQEPPKPMPEKVEAPPAAAAPATPAPVVVHPAPAPITYSPECGCAEASGCCEREGLFARMRKWFSKGDDCGCGCETTVHVAPKVHHHAAPCDCDPCASSKPRLFDRIRGLFSKGDDCGCDPCAAAPAPCSNCGSVISNGTVIHPAPMPSTEPAKEMVAPPATPEAPKKLPEARNLRIAPPVIEVTPTVGRRF